MKCSLVCGINALKHLACGMVGLAALVKLVRILAVGGFYMPQRGELSRRITTTKPHGFSFLIRNCSSEERLRVMRYLSGCREALILDLGPREEDLSAAKLILIDRLISLLGVTRGIEEHFKDNLFTPSGDLQNALGSHYLAYSNSIRLILTTLGIERRAGKEPTIQDIIADFDKKA